MTSASLRGNGPDGASVNTLVVVEAIDSVWKLHMVRDGDPVTSTD